MSSMEANDCSQQWRREERRAGHMLRSLRGGEQGSSGGVDGGRG